MDEGDLVSYGLLGLIGAIERFDPGREIKFETYAISASRARSSTSCVAGLGAALGALAGPRDRARDARPRERCSRPPTDEIAAAIGITEEFPDSLTAISRTSVAALDELWRVSTGGGDTVS